MDVAEATVTAALPLSLSSVHWSCTASPGSSCAAGAGNGNIATTVTLLASGSATFVVTATVSPAAAGTLTNTVTVEGVTTDPVPGNNSATDADLINAQAIPTLGEIGLAALTLLLAAAGALLLKR